MKQRKIHRLITVQPNPVAKARSNWIVRSKRTISKHVRKDMAILKARAAARKRGFDYMVFFSPRHKRQQRHPSIAMKRASKKVKVKRKQIVRPKRFTAHRAFKRSFKQPRTGFSKSRLGQIAMKPTSIYEKQMVGRIQKQTGMTHFQIMNLVNLDRHSDLVDIETEISQAAGFSKSKPEIYEHARKNIMGKLSAGKNASQKISESELSGYVDYWEDQANQWNMQQKKSKINVNVI